MAKEPAEPTDGDPASQPAPDRDPSQPPPEAPTSKMGIACVGVLILIVVGIIALAAIAGRA